MEEEGHVTHAVEPWPAGVTRDDHPTPHEADCISAASAETLALAGYYAWLSEICD